MSCVLVYDELFNNYYWSAHPFIITCRSLGFSPVDVLPSCFYYSSSTYSLPQPVFFFIPSQLVSSLAEPPLPELIPPLPPAARNRFSIKSLVTVITSQSCWVREAVRLILKSDEMPVSFTAKSLPTTCLTLEKVDTKVN